MVYTIHFTKKDSLFILPNIFILIRNIAFTYTENIKEYG